MSRSLLALLIAAALAVITAPASGRTGPRASAASSGRSATEVHIRGSRFGRLLVDRNGYTLYLFTRDRAGRSRCFGGCADAWPPVIVKRRPAAGRGARASLLGTTRRKDGRLQATYGGHPLYYYVGERSPRQILCQNVNEYGGDWLIVSAAGHAIR